jgi:hypothetical protein
MLFWDSAARLGEIRALNLKNIDFDHYGAVCYLPNLKNGDEQERGATKTGSRRIRLVDSAPDLQLWVNQHPTRDNPDSPLFVAVGVGKNMRKKSFNRLHDVSIYHTIKKLGKNAGIKKDLSPHKIRHARLTHLAKKGFNEMELRIFAGWSDESQMPATYLHIAGNDVETKTLKVAGIKIKEDYSNEQGLEPVNCPRCSRMNSKDSKYCAFCSMVLDSRTALEVDSVRKDLAVSMTVGEKILAKLETFEAMEKRILELEKKLTAEI